MLRYDALIFAMILLLGFLSSGAQSATVSQHNEPHAGIQAAIDRLDEQGCTRYQVTRSGQYTLNDSVDATSYTLTGNTITIECTRWAVEPVPELAGIELTWTRPTLRIDGATLPADQISGYMLNADGVLVFVSGGNTLSYLDDEVRSGVHTYSIATVDTSAQIGPYSLPLTVTVD